MKSAIKVSFILTVSFLFFSASAQLTPPGGGGTNNNISYTNSFGPVDYGSNLWIELKGITNGIASIKLHNTTNAVIYQVFEKTNLNDPLWTPIAGPAYGTSGTNQTYFPSVDTLDYWRENAEYLLPLQNKMFFNVYGGKNSLVIYPYDPITTLQPTSTNDSSHNVTNYIQFEIARSATPSSVSCKIFGTAVYGLDFTIIGGSYSNSLVTTTIPAGSYSSPPLVIVPLYKTNAVFELPYLTLALTLGGQYIVDSSVYSRTITISNSIPFTVVTNLQASYLAGIAYHPVQNALIVSANNPSGQPNNFVLIGTNSSGGATIANWSDVAGVPNEVESTVVRISTNGFIKGDTYFGNDTVIDKLSADGSEWVTNWCPLISDVETNDGRIVGICIDETGAFSNNLIAVTASGGVWSIQTNANGSGRSVWLTNTPSTGLSGVITLTNDVSKWGPWAGKIITGDAGQGCFYAIATNNIVTSYNTSQMGSGGIAIEAFALVRPNEDLYFVDASSSQILKVSRNALASYAGDLLVTQTATTVEAGYYSPPAKLFIIAWDQVDAKFKVKAIPVSGILENATFAPLNLPSH